MVSGNDIQRGVTFSANAYAMDTVMLCTLERVSESVGRHKTSSENQLKDHRMQARMQQ
ncbi:uncharacterized protein FOMMEDRAFT_154712 [Fomitiporia mediterranea MF3/22]|uniref:uncharacterized protein n=1 Tax=Fomitiporia mediterranea (strain MF3/22) TaxID=694068 RepID=UPI0004407CF9|nr:uncharacterized protein FOMMEDRAFT_154712 [Fomitiporia mediterranea MF3/22]EJD03620.1 hypothetical protein FOMMEDRAFT_154712 [Fomitiporia mediterranea MF3/22]